MGKKGFTGTEALKWLLGLFVLFVILYVLFGPKELFAQTKDTLFNFVYIFVPEEKAPQVKLKSRIPAGLEKSFDDLVSKIKNSGSGEGCRIEIGEVAKTGEFRIAFYTDKIQIEKKSEKGLTPHEKTEAIEGLKPCVVKGDKASRFYYCLSNSIGCTDAYEEGNLIIDKDSTIAPFLFKFDNSHICVVYLGSDFIPGCSDVKDKIDSACVDKIRRTYPDCSIVASPRK